jgi:hypothetical protein
MNVNLLGIFLATNIILTRFTSKRMMLPLGGRQMEYTVAADVKRSTGVRKIEWSYDDEAEATRVWRWMHRKRETIDSGEPVVRLHPLIIPRNR